MNDIHECVIMDTRDERISERTGEDRRRARAAHHELHEVITVPRTAHPRAQGEQKVMEDVSVRQRVEEIREVVKGDATRAHLPRRTEEQIHDCLVPRHHERDP